MRKSNPWNCTSRRFGIRVTLRSEPNAEQAALLAAVEEDIGYGSADPIRIPGDMVEWVGIEGPVLSRASSSRRGTSKSICDRARRAPVRTLELRLTEPDSEGQGGEIHSYEAEVAHFDDGHLGSSLDLLLCAGTPGG